LSWTFIDVALPQPIRPIYPVRAGLVPATTVSGKTALFVEALSLEEAPIQAPKTPQHWPHGSRLSLRLNGQQMVVQAIFHCLAQITALLDMTYFLVKVCAAFQHRR
jgi:hypothetical protein